MKSKPPSRMFLPIFCIAAILSLSVQAKNCLWKATSAEKTFYLQGSVHVLKPENYPLDPAIEEAYAQCGTLVFEADLHEMTKPETQTMLMRKAMFPKDRTLKSELSPEVYGMLMQELAESGLPEASVQRFKPWFVSILILVPRLQAMGLNPELGLDQYFYRKATADRKTVVGLETVEFQFSLFESLSDEDQDAYTRYFLTDLEQSMTMVPEILSAWNEGDLDSLNSIFTEAFKEYPGMKDKFLTQRNQAWVKKLMKMPSSDQPVMVVVGSAHLAGDEGLIERFKTEGYTVEQL